jgi:hypothetical protein
VSRAQKTVEHAGRSRRCCCGHRHRRAYAACCLNPIVEACFTRPQSLCLCRCHDPPHRRLDLTALFLCRLGKHKSCLLHMPVRPHMHRFLAVFSELSGRQPFIEPVTTRACAHTFCKSCITHALCTSRHCPIDRSALSSSGLVRATPVIRDVRASSVFAWRVGYLMPRADGRRAHRRVQQSPVRLHAHMPKILVGGACQRRLSIHRSVVSRHDVWGIYI